VRFAQTAEIVEGLERETRLELATPTLARSGKDRGNALN